MPVGQRKDPYRNFRFLVEIDGIVQAGFSEVTLPDSTQDVVEYREGHEPPVLRKLPGLAKYGNVTLKWGVTDSLELYEWRRLVEQGKIAEARRNMAIIVLDEEGEPAARWEFYQAWPSKYDAPDLNAKGNEVAIETLEIAHEGMKRTA
ncbi:MAG TPA: phage tail protein [Thermodesulfatator atlanticus]|uniref:Phage tail protein n=1 Tax=Thermodesulfatator atlanticus TaxID=501497 RepID=A0A7V5NY05_9BACT|nr:phage tail protein [Thermodesulfatator atlanticus]